MCVCVCVCVCGVCECIHVLISLSIYLDIGWTCINGVLQFSQTLPHYHIVEWEGH